MTQNITRRAFNKALALLGLASPATAMSQTPTTVLAEDARDPIVIMAYWNWLASEQKLLQEEMQPGSGQHGRWTPCNTGIDDFHGPAWRQLTGTGYDRLQGEGVYHPWADKLPSERANPILTAAGVDTAKLIKQQRRWS